MNEYLIRTAKAYAYENMAVAAVIRAGIVEEEIVVNVIHSENPILAGDALIGAWDPQGQQVEPFDQAAYEQIRPLGNNPSRDLFDEAGNVIGQTRGGDATQDLLYHHFDGWTQRNLSGSPAATGRSALYPQDNQPFDIEIRHKLWTGQPDPGWNGWGWRAEMHGDAAQRDPGVYAIGVYSDAECTIYEYTTGAFVQGPSEWQRDSDDNPLTVWFTETPLGRANADMIDWHLAVLYASIQSGYRTLSAGAEAIRYLFWENTQPSPGGGDTWTDTGATVVSQAGTLYQISSEAVAAELTVGQEIRFGDAAETTFDGVWTGGADYIQIDPFVQAQIGDALWAKGFLAQTRNGNLDQWFRTGNTQFQLLPGVVWMVRWKKRNGDASEWYRLARFLSTSLFNKKVRSDIYKTARLFKYEGDKPR